MAAKRKRSEGEEEERLSNSNSKEGDEGNSSQKRVCSSSKMDEEGLLVFCSICMQPWTNAGDHHMCCLPCGHIYGMSCVKKWLQRNKNSRRCPQCNSKCTLKDVRKLYASQLVVVDEESQKDRTQESLPEKLLRTHTDEEDYSSLWRNSRAKMLRHYIQKGKSWIDILLETAGRNEDYIRHLNDRVTTLLREQGETVMDQEAFELETYERVVERMKKQSIYAGIIQDPADFLGSMPSSCMESPLVPSPAGADEVGELEAYRERQRKVVDTLIATGSDQAESICKLYTRMRQLEAVGSRTDS